MQDPAFLLKGHFVRIFLHIININKEQTIGNDQINLHHVIEEDGYMLIFLIFRGVQFVIHCSEMFPF